MVDTKASGRFVLRLDPGLHGALRATARARGLSLNEYCARKLAVPLADLHEFDGAPETIRHAAAVLGEGLIAVVVFGSWTRGEASDGSDVDVLIVVDEDVPLTRGLYRRWDEAPLAWGRHPVEPHFVHPPATDQPASGFWAEIALDGVMLHQRDLRVARWLAAIRRQVADGSLRRRTAHGQSYWTREA